MTYVLAEFSEGLLRKGWNISGSLASQAAPEFHTDKQLEIRSVKAQ